MEFDFHVRGLGGEGHISRWDAQALRKLSAEDMKNITDVVTVMGKHSAVAQSLGAPITDIWRLKSTDQRLYLYAVRRSSGTSVLGGIKIGKKKLFIRTDTAAFVEAEPLSVLDFYVHESCQRQGVGKQLFEYALAAEQQVPAGMAYDRPSPKLLAFLKKHYGLKDHVPQSNNYVVYNDFFHVHQLAPMQRGRLPGMATKPSPKPAAPSGAYTTPPHQPSPVHAASVPPWLQLPSPPAAPAGHYPGRSLLPPGPPGMGGVGSAGPVPQPGSSGRPWQYGGADGGYSGSPVPLASVPGLMPSYSGSPVPPVDPLGVGYGTAAAPSLQRTGSGGSGYGFGFGASSGPYQAGGSGSQPSVAGPSGSGYVGTGLKTKLVMPAPEQGWHPFMAGAAGEHGVGSGATGVQGAPQLSGRSLQPSQSFGQRWGQSNILAVGPGTGAPSTGQASGMGPSPSNVAGAVPGRPPSGASARPPSGSPYGQDPYAVAPAFGLPQAPHQGRQRGADALDNFRQQQAQQRHTPQGQHAVGGGSSGAGAQFTPRPPPWAVDEKDGNGSPGMGAPTPAALMSQPVSGSGALQSPVSGQGTAGPGPSPSARAAALAARSGAGAAGCLVW